MENEGNGWPLCLFLIGPCFPPAFLASS